jgi:ABC-type nickel/cobalt efflux system permease component RcnA
VTWRSLLALGISGGLLPCPSALVVLLSAISLHRVGYGLLLVIAFSIGLAATLTAVGLAFLYAGRFMKRAVGSNRLIRLLPAASALFITCVGATICYEALSSAGISFADAFGFLTDSTAETSSLSTASLLSIGLVFGMKHAIDADHIAAVSTIVSERKGLLRSSLIGGLWGIGHTISLLIAGIAVLFLHIEIGEKMALALELCVALMLIGLGANALYKLRGGAKLHLHSHSHGSITHLHPHLHDETTGPELNTHHRLRLSARPLIVGMVHGLAGSAALMLLVLSTVQSQIVGMAYIAMFGIGSIGGMMIMSIIVSLPAQFTANRFVLANRAARMLAAIFSLGFGIYMFYEVGFLEGLFI